MRTGVLGGTFDPPHLGHLALAAAARNALSLDWVLLVPAGDPYRKAARRVTPPTLRLRMTRAAIANLPWAEVSTLELERRGPSYTTETLEALAQGAGDWWFIVGQDVLSDLPHWREPARIARHARLAVARRPGAPEGVPSEVVAVIPGIEERIDWIVMPPLRVSSTDLRQRVANGASTEVLLPLEVRAIIDEAGLYRG